MDFGALPPEVNSGRMYSGPGPATLLAASAEWEELAAEMHLAASQCESVVAQLIGESWRGSSATAMTQAVLPYAGWVRSTAARCEDVATKATVAASAYETAYAMMVPPPVIVANRARLAALIASNLVGQNTPAIMVAEAEYSEMWAQDAAAMYSYAANSAGVSGLSSFAPPPSTTDPGEGASAKLLNSAASTLRGLAGPGNGASIAMGAGAPLASSGISSSLTMLSRLAKTSAKSPGTSTTAGMQAAAQLATSAITALLDIPSSTAPEIGTSALGFGSDGLGLGTDISGFALDLAGSGLELVGGDSLLGAEEAVPAELGAIGPLDLLNPLADPWSAGLSGEPSAALSHASQLGTLSVPPGWADALSKDAGSQGMHGAASAGYHGPAHRHAGKLPVGGMVGHDGGRPAHRVGVQTSLIPRSPIGG
ncbi:PPE family protein [Mycobacterium stomatepiae]|uniref:PPE family protein n=1 Tax=Mycobacterium stomatepiae TaxID=470076 RepID=A0A7I7Q5E5_9MYCO|nr:PPE family protein [Mycobacterium stomatepiae]MCV7163440.1 PPE family protein [Mycobacterium stomatepiae]BBY21469.1 PPE family protein [Mycobacterium stomatepiae]